MKICLDAGHGGNTGARGNGLIEDVIALDFVTRVGHHLRAKGVQTVLTRKGNGFVPLEDRPPKAVGCDMFVSFHNNAASNKIAHGAEILVAAGDKRSKDKAREVLNRICAGGAMVSRGVKWDNQGQHKSLYVLQNTYRKMPSMLIEMGFLTNVGDASWLNSKEWREAISIKIADALIDVCK